MSLQPLVDAMECVRPIACRVEIKKKIIDDKSSFLDETSDVQSLRAALNNNLLLYPV
jgi:hypothetical protein